MIHVRRNMFGKYCTSSFQCLKVLGIIYLVTFSKAEEDSSRKLGILRERIRRLERRLSEDISLIREEFYDELDALTDDGEPRTPSPTKATSGESEFNVNEQKTAMENQLETLRETLLRRLKIFDEGIKDEKRIRRNIQNDICEIKSGTGDIATSISKLSQDITAKLDTVVEKISVNETLHEIAELLDNLNKHLVDNVRYKDDESNDKVQDCSGWLRSGHNRSGMYTVFPETIWRPIDVYCDMETLGGGWTVFQRRQDGSENFKRNWLEYTFGFGNPLGEFWLGNEFIHRLTSHAPHELLIELEDFENQHRFASYGMFSIGSAAELFKLNVNFFKGNVTDDLTKHHNGKQFSTFDNGPSTACAESYSGGWWYGSCHAVNINGLYLKGEHKSYANGVNWHGWRGYHYSLKRSEMKFRPY